MKAKLWKCPKCKREFGKRNQSHSCNIYPLEKHFKGKEKAKALFVDLASKAKKLGKFKIDSLPCCIHLSTAFTFAGVYALKDKIRISFSSPRKLKTARLKKPFRLSANRYLYLVEVKSKREINGELMGWLRQAYNIKK